MARLDRLLKRGSARRRSGSTLRRSPTKHQQSRFLAAQMNSERTGAREDGQEGEHGSSGGGGNSACNIAFIARAPTSVLMLAHLEIRAEASLAWGAREDHSRWTILRLQDMLGYRMCHDNTTYRYGTGIPDIVSTALDSKCFHRKCLMGRQFSKVKWVVSSTMISVRTQRIKIVHQVKERVQRDRHVPWRKKLNTPQGDVNLSATAISSELRDR